MYLWATFVPFYTYQDLLPVSQPMVSRDMPITYLLTPWSRAPLEKLTGFCS